MTLEYKDFSPVLKALDDKGKGQAIIATLNTIDRDGDITHAGAFGEQDVKVLMAHKWDQPSVGYARLRESGSSVVADFELNLNMHAGREVYESLKFDHARGRLQEWSYGFQVVEHEKGMHEGKQVRFLKKVKAWEISPVVAGAGVGTGTLVLKEAPWDVTPPSATSPILSLNATTDPPHAGAHAITPHHTPTDDRVWSAWVQQSRIKDTSDRMNYYNALYAVADAHGAKERRQFRGLHHFVEDEGEPGSASTRACLELINALHKGMVPAHEREGLYTHVAAHLRDAGIEAPPLTAPDHYGVPLDMRVQTAAWVVDAVVEDLIGIHDMRSRKGMTLTEARLQQVKELWQRLDAFCQVLQLKAFDKPYSVQLEEFANQQFVQQLNERLDARAQAIEAQKVETHRAEAEEHYRRFVEIERRLRNVSTP